MKQYQTNLELLSQLNIYMYNLCTHQPRDIVTVTDEDSTSNLYIILYQIPIEILPMMVLYVKVFNAICISFQNTQNIQHNSITHEYYIDR